MKIKKFLAPSLREALAQVKAELGPDAIIINTREFKDGGIGGLFKGKQQVEVTAAIEEELMPSRNYYATKQYKNTGKENTETKLDNDAKVIAEGLRRFQQELPKMRSATKRNRVAPEKKIEPNVREIYSEKTDNSEIHQLKEELSEMKSLLTALREQFDYKDAKDYPEIFRKYYKNLIDNEIEQRLAKEIISKSFKEYEQKAKDLILEEHDVLDILTKNVAEYIHAAGHIKFFPNKPAVVFLIGPTGVGKTTTIAKIAAIFSIYEKKKVALLTIDTYRLAAVEQLKAFANIVNLPLYTIYNYKDMEAIKRKFAEFDLVLIDTAGRSQKDRDKLLELRNYIQIANPTEVHLVLSMTTKYFDLIDILKKFSVIPINRMIFSKLDETTRVGNLLNIVKTVKGKISYITTGQDVPDDIELADSYKLASLILQGVSDE